MTLAAECIIAACSLRGYFEQDLQLLSEAEGARAGRGSLPGLCSSVPYQRVSSQLMRQLFVVKKYPQSRQVK